jgi:putative spermidine/putrescine transport system ATP-binding protein
MQPRKHSASVRLEGVDKSYDGRVKAVAGVSLDIRPGEFFSLLGPSGCGKTTTLRLIAGFESIDRGRILIGDREITGVPAHKRDMSMVFQSYALFPHRTVAENVAFGLRMRRVARSEIDARVREVLDLVALSGFDERRPAQLSGGQQQRVALARAIVVRPPVLLCDEPLAALDRRLRQQMQFELKQLQKRLGVTLLLVTHDQEEALAMSDRIAVMSEGRIEQIGTPSAIYDRPVSRFVADFIGEINLIEGLWSDGRFATPEGTVLPVPQGAAREGRKATLALRPEKVCLTAPGEGLVRGRLETVNFLGPQVLLRVILGNGRGMLVKVPAAGGAVATPGSDVGLAWGADDVVVLEA